MAYKLKQLKGQGIPTLLDGIASKEDWDTKREDIMERWRTAIGEIPFCPPRIQTVFLSVDEEADHYRIHLKYETAFNDWVTAYLLVPSKLTPNLALANVEEKMFTNLSAPVAPAVLALHPTSPAGKDDVALEGGRENRTYGWELVKRGYVVLAPDAITAGERVEKGSEPYQTAPFYEKHPEWSAVAKMIVDHQHGISLLKQMPFIGKIGAIGHSLGGYNAFFLAGMDKRVEAVVCSCGFAVFVDDPEKERWGRRDWFSHIPKVSDYLANGEVPFEFNEIAALVAPAPMFMWTGQKDKIFPHWEQAVKALEDVDALYDFLGEEEGFTSIIGNSGHDFPEPIRALGYSFLDKHLKDQ